jgi:peptide-methionine (R)-S-oxide reductase
MNRRNFLFASSAAAALGFGKSSLAEGKFEITRTEAEWRALLTDFEYQVLREEATERAGTSPLNHEKREGIFACKGCDLPLYSSKTKYDSGTGWPSFWQAMDDAVKTKRDVSVWGIRTELHCRRCGSHLGHVFNDGPQPTGKRHCINGVSLKFQEA